jgi:hypothetical protein
VSLCTIMSLVQQDLLQAQQKISSGQLEEAQVAALTGLRCLASIAKAFQSPDDEPMEADEEAAAQQFWYSGPGSEAQNQIYSIIRGVLQMFDQSQEPMELHGEVVEAVCNTFKAGFAESKPGPFVFPASAFVDFFSTMQLSTPRLEIVLSTACSFLRSHSHSSSSDVMQEATRLLAEVLRFIRSIYALREEDNTTGLLDVMERFMPRYTKVFFTLQQDDLETLFSFPLECLAIPEPLPKRAAAQFWVPILPAYSHQQPILTTIQTTFLALTSARTKTTQAHLDDVINHFGPRLAMGIIRNVAGGATRTDLDWFAEPLKKLSTRTVYARKLLEEALAAVDAGPAVGPDIKARFMKQIAV